MSMVCKNAAPLPSSFGRGPYKKRETEKEDRKGKKNYQRNTHTHTHIPSIECWA